MKTKTCGECLYYDDPFCDYHAMKVASKRKSCDLFDPKEKPPTNGDRIRQMSDEELTLLIVQGRCRLCPYGFDGDCYNDTAKSCKDIILEQLKQEAKDE